MRMTSPVLLKISGHELDDPEYLTLLAQTAKNLPRPLVLVHGGGKGISELQEKFGIVPEYKDGLRVTDEASLRILEMAVRGTLNVRIVSALVAQGIEAIGLSGVDLGLVRGRTLPGLGFVGTPEHVRTEVFDDFFAKSIVPVICPVMLGETGRLNVNADTLAGAIAAAIHAERIYFVSNVKGVLKDGKVIPELSENEVLALIDEGVITGGMIPKVKAALEVLGEVSEAVICDLQSFAGGGGTRFRTTTSLSLRAKRRKP